MVLHSTIPSVGAAAGRETTIAMNGDFVIRLTPPVTRPLAESSVYKPAVHPHVFEFRVSRAILISHSTFFQDLFRVQPTLPIIVFENNGISRGLEVWLRAIHNGAETIPPSLLPNHSEKVWGTIAVGHQFGFAPQHVAALRSWFLAHYHDIFDNGPGLTSMIARSNAFPCFLFDHAAGFMKLTKYLAYNTKTSLFTENFQTVGVDTRFLDGPLTAARTHIQSTLERELYYPLGELHQARCACRKETAFDYEDALIALECWPLEDAARRFTLSELMEKLNNFDSQPNVRICESGVCNLNFKKSVEIAIDRTKQCFQGLCLDCMNRSKPVIGQTHEEVIEKNSPYAGCWDMDCRFGHGRPSWFFSWMGSSATRTLIVDKHRRETLGKRQRESMGLKGRWTKRDSGRPPISRNVPSTNGHSAISSITKGSTKSPSRHSVKKNDRIVCNKSNVGIDDDDDEFFDAEEDKYLDGLTAHKEHNG